MWLWAASFTEWRAPIDSHNFFVWIATPKVVISNVANGRRDIESKTSPILKDLARKWLKGVQIYFSLGQDGVWGPPTMQFGEIWQYLSTSRLKIGRPKEGWTGLCLSPSPDTWTFWSSWRKLLRWTFLRVLVFRYIRARNECPVIYHICT